MTLAEEHVNAPGRGADQRSRQALTSISTNTNSKSLGLMTSCLKATYINFIQVFQATLSKDTFKFPGEHLDNIKTKQQSSQADHLFNLGKRRSNSVSNTKSIKILT